MWYVDGSVSESGRGTSWQTAFQTTQEGINAASDGDTVIVGEGTYFENIRLNGKNITVRSTDPLNPSAVANTVIDGDRTGPAIRFSGTEYETCVLSGLTIRGGRAERGGGICGGASNSPTRATIRNNRISNNIAIFGRGLANCIGAVRGNLITGNSAEDTGGLCVSRGAGN